MITLNTVIPDFSAITDDNKTIQFSDYRGQNLLLYFYPKDNTAGCTQEAQDFRDTIAQFSALNTVILGVSRDSVRTHENFKAKHDLPFDLIADTNESLCELFGVMVIKNMYGKQARGIERSSFLINSDGVLIHQWRKVKVKGHIEAILKVLETQSS
ncbi:MAG: peroxiredoxin [Methylococcaceae bacterium]